MALRNSFIARQYNRFIENAVLPRLSGIFPHPNHFTLLGLGIALLVPLGFYVHPLAGWVFMILSGVSDTLDGMAARKAGKESALGAFLDSSLDRCSDFCFLSGFWVLFLDSGRFFTASVLIFICMFLTQMISYTKARAQGMGVSCDTGLMERGTRTLFLMVWGGLVVLFPAHALSLLWVGLLLFFVLTLMTVIQRFYHITSSLK